MEYSIDNWPTASWRLFSDTSVWNTPLDKSKVDPNSDIYIASMCGDGPPKDYTAKARSDWGFPLYFGREIDPSYKIVLSETSAPFEKEIDGLSIHAPAGMLPSSASDGVLRVIDQTSGWMYHLQRASVDETNHIINAWRSYRLEAYGSGFHDIKEPPTGLLPIRPEELAAGFVHHTIGLHAKCLSGHSVAPYDSSGTKGQMCDTDDATTRISMGNIVFLNLSLRKINRLSIPIWQKAILRGLSVHGALVGFNGSASWSLTFEAPQDRTAFGRPDPYAALGLPETLAIANALDSVGGWRANLKVLAPFSRPI